MAVLPDGTMIKKHHVLLFVNSGTPSVPVWTRIRKSTDLTIAQNTETRDFDYIEDESPSTEADRVKPSLSQPITMYKGNPDFEFFYSKFYNQSVGADAHAEILVVFFSSGDTSPYDAWKSDCVIIIDNMNAVDSTLTANINFNGTTDKGTAVVTDGVPVFTGDSTTEFALTITAEDAATDPIEGATVTIGGVEKTTNADGEAVFFLIDGETYTVGAYTATLAVASVFEADDTSTTMTLTLV